MNKVILMGRLTKDPETRFTQTNNKQVTNFTLAVNRRFTEDTDFINIVSWNKTAEFVSKYFRKGQQVAVVGSIQTRTYDDKDGKKVYVTEVLAEEVYFADSKKENNNTTTSQEEFAPIQDDDELPF